jgi:hypothetical protein
MTDQYMVMARIQSTLKVPKGQYNKFGDFYYRNCEDIYEALKPALAEFDASIIVSDELAWLGERMYVKATATLHAPGFTMQAVGYAREPYEKKGWDVSQITGSASSYARKVALSGLFALDDSRDVDSEEDGLMHGQVDTAPINFDKVHQAVDFFRAKIDIDQIDETYELMQKAHSRLTNDEQAAVAKKLSELGKAAGSRKKYTTLLKEHLEYVPPEPPPPDFL